jgi:hypothetical protein
MIKNLFQISFPRSQSCSSSSSLARVLQSCKKKKELQIRDVDGVTIDKREKKSHILYLHRSSTSRLFQKSTSFHFHSQPSSSSSSSAKSAVSSSQRTALEKSIFQELTLARGAAHMSLQ